jgi:UDP-2,4-diacetamido-2,4,6-trideoxy-beta-L-altropyranose hydrolase
MTSSADGRLRLRATGPLDRSLLREWRNDPTSVRFSGSKRPVGLAEHRAWFDAALQSNATAMWIGEIDGRPVGQVRIDLRDDCAEVAIAVAPEARGLGHGTRLIRAVQAECAERAVRVLVAKVDPQNIASLRMFDSCGFVEIGHADGLAVLRWEA